MTGQRVLVVDDDPDIVEFFGLLLEDDGFEVASANRAATALEEMDRFHPDLVVVDVLLPGRSGLDLLVTLRRHPRWGEVPVVVVTGNDVVVRDECQSYLVSHEGVRGPDGILAKPIVAGQLFGVVRTLLA